MIKGCQKKIIHLRNTGSPYFEEAYFILKDNGNTLQHENDMVKEALKIAEASLPEGRGSSGFFKNAIPALIGAAAASFIFGVILLFVAL